MSVFDSELFASRLCRDAKRMSQNDVELIELQNDIDVTFSAIEICGSQERLLQIRYDFATFFPARKAAILTKFPALLVELNKIELAVKALSGAFTC